MSTEVREPSAKYLVSRDFKQTEIGSIPSDWIVEPLGKRATFRTGPFGSALHKSDYVTDGTPIINPMHIVDGLIVPTVKMTVTDIAARMLSDFCVKTGEIVIGRRGDMGRCAVVREKNAGWICGTGSMIIRPERTNADFLQRVLSSPKIVGAIEDAAVGTTMVNLNQGTLANLKIQFPPRNEQDAIATALSDVDALIAGLEKLIAKKRDIKQAAMQQLLTGQTRLPGFSGEWTMKTLGDIAHIQKGQLITTETLVPGNVPVIAGGKKPAYFHNKPNRQGKTITVSASGASAGYVAFHSSPIFASDCSTISEAKNYCIEFVYFSLQINQEVIYSAQTGGAQPHIQPKDLSPLVVSLPITLVEQEAIAKVLCDIDDELVALESRLAKIRDLKQGMMQELLTGRTRLI